MHHPVAILIESEPCTGCSQQSVAVCALRKPHRIRPRSQHESSGTDTYPYRSRLRQPGDFQLSHGSRMVVPLPVTITWTALIGRTYRLQATALLSGTKWNDISGDITASATLATKSFGLEAS